MNIYDYEQYPIYKSLIELNEELKKVDIEPITLNVIGGFAMMVNNARSKDGITDIDYIGPQLSEDIVKIAEKIGKTNGMVSHWINNDTMISGTTLEDFEKATGKLHFFDAFELEKIHINVINTEDLLRLKVIAIDTALSAVNDGNSDFTRMKDFRDISVLMEKLNFTPQDLADKFDDYIVNIKTIPVIEIYEREGEKAVNQFIKDLRFEIEKRERELYAANKNYTRTSFIDNILNQAYTKKNLEEKQSQKNELWEEEHERQLEEITGIDIGKTGFRDKRSDPKEQDYIEEQLENIYKTDLGKPGFKNRNNNLER